MRASRVLGLVAAAAALGAVAGAPADAGPVHYQTETLPAIAAGGGKTVVAWTQNGMVQTAEQNADGSFGPGTAVGRSLGSHSPRLVITPAGEQVLVWLSGTALRSAVRAPGARVWKLEQAATAPRMDGLRLVMDPTGRAIAIWTLSAGAPTFTYSLWSSTRLPGGSWSTPIEPAGSADVASASIALDSRNDAVIVYRSDPPAAPDPGGDTDVVWAIGLPSGATAWSAPVVISGSDLLAATSPELAGGGDGTFVATWSIANPAALTSPAAPASWRSARLRLPGAWEAPQSLLPPQTKTDSFAYATLPALRVGARGDALAILLASGITSLRLPSSSSAWEPPVTVDAPGAPELIDSTPSLVPAPDGSASVVFFRIGAPGATLRIATGTGSPPGWEGQDADLALINTCSSSRFPAGSLTCPLGSYDRPIVAADGAVSLVAAQSISGDAFVVARDAPAGAWGERTALVPVARTGATLRTASPRKGSVQAVVTCTLPPCRGVIALRLRDHPSTILGRASLAFARAGSAVRVITLSQSARKRLARGGRLHTRITFDVHEGDGTSEQTRLPFELSGKSWVRAREELGRG